MRKYAWVDGFTCSLSPCCGVSAEQLRRVSCSGHTHGRHRRWNWHVVVASLLLVRLVSGSIGFGRSRCYVSATQAVARPIARWHASRSAVALRACDELVDCSEILHALRRENLPRNKRRAARLGAAQQDAYGLTFGLATDYGKKRTVLTAATKIRPALARILCAACRSAEPAFRFTSIQVNLNTRYRLHTDGDDAGPSRMLCCGNFSAGRMWLHDWDASLWRPVDAHSRFIAFDGREYHLTEDWIGPERYSLVYFTHPGWHSQRLDPTAKAKLIELGFPWPTEQDIFAAPLPASEARLASAEQNLPPKLRVAAGIMPPGTSSRQFVSAGF